MSRSDATKFGRVIAHSRIYTDVRFSEEIARLANTKSDFEEENAKRDKADIANLTARYEIRFKSVSSIINKFGSNQILEIASGLSSRGIEFTSNPKITFVETDLLEVISDKSRIIKQILSEQNIKRQNLYLQSVDATNYSELRRSTDLLSKPLTIVCEGLLSNLKLSTLRCVVENICSLLSDFGGKFITPDFYNSEQRQNSLASETEVHTFKNDDEIFALFDEFELRFERFLQKNEVSKISCSKPFDKEVLNRQLENRYVYVIQNK